jgi:hypothetical protein
MQNEQPQLMCEDEVARIICRSYPDFDLLGVDLQTVTMAELRGRAARHDQGDTLFDFIVLEVNEACDDQDDDKLDVGQVIHALQRARDDLDKVIAGLEDAAEAAAGKERP